jgi:NADP-dependent 3-hydroxy acid dehydrogenase YdfG
MAEHRTLDGDVVAITGASSGIGAATARELVAAGAHVVLAARRADRLADLVAELGPAAHAVQCDVREPASGPLLVRAAVETFGRLDALVASAGIGAYGGILDHSDETLAEILDTNVAGTVWPVRAAVRHFREHSGGDLVIVSSVAGLRGGADEAVYAATKFAQVGLAGSLDRELRPHGIRVSAICPAGVETEFALGAGRTAGEPALAAMLRPEDVADAVVTVLRQPRRLRSTLWVLWSMAEGS